MNLPRLHPTQFALATLFFLALVAPAAPPSREPGKFPRPSLIVPTPGRIAEIRAWVGAKPVGPGRPISDRAAWREAAARLDEKELLTAAEEISKQPPPELPDDLFLLYTHKGSRMEYQHVFERRRSRLSVLVWAEGVEARGRFLLAIARELAAILSEKTWVLPAHDPLLGNFHGSVVEVDLGVATRGWTLALVDYWLGERLPAELRPHLRTELHRRVIAPYLAMQHGAPRSRGLGWITTTNNWNAVCHAGVIGTALALGGAPDECAELIAAAELNLRHYYEGFTSEGYCDEGIAYWNYGFGHCVMLAETVAQATGGQVRLLAGSKARRSPITPGTWKSFPACSPSFPTADSPCSPRHLSGDSSKGSSA